MLQNKFEMPLDLTIKPSKIFYYYLIAVFIFSFISIFISTSLPLMIRLILFLLLLLMGVFIVKKHRLKQFTCLRLNNKDQWSLEINNEEHIELVLTGECIVTYLLIWLNFTTCNIEGKNKIFHLLLLPDSSDADLLRQLRVRLRFLSKTNKDEKDEVEIY